MNPTIYNFTLDMHSAVSQATLSARRGDRSPRYISVTLTAGGIPYEIEHGCYAVLNAKRASDGKVFFGDCIIKDNSITYSVTELVSSSEGRLDCDITLYSPEGEAITSPSFTVIVYAGATDGDEIRDTDDFRALGELVRAAEDAKESAEFSAMSAAHGGAISFNGRVGVVMPEAGDYDAEMVGADPKGAAGSAVTAHDVNKTAHAELFNDCSKNGHPHKASDVSDFDTGVENKLASFGAARIAFGRVTPSNGAITIAPGFTPQMIMLHSGYGDGETCSMLYALKGQTGALELVQKVNTEGNIYRQDVLRHVTWDFYKVSVSAGSGEQSYIVIG